MNSLEKLYKSIEESKLYKDYKKISTILEEDDSIQKLIIEKKMLELKNNQIYIEYMNKMEEFNNVLKESSNIIESYIEEKV